jgi:hypothetical protein
MIGSQNRMNGFVESARDGGGELEQEELEFEGIAAGEFGRLG